MGIGAVGMETGAALSAHRKVHKKLREMLWAELDCGEYIMEGIEVHHGSAELGDVEGEDRLTVVVKARRRRV